MPLAAFLRLACARISSRSSRCIGTDDLVDHKGILQLALKDSDGCCKDQASVSPTNQHTCQFKKFSERLSAKHRCGACLYRVAQPGRSIQILTVCIDSKNLSNIIGCGLDAHENDTKRRARCSHQNKIAIRFLNFHTNNLKPIGLHCHHFHGCCR